MAHILRRQAEAILTGQGCELDFRGQKLAEKLGARVVLVDQLHQILWMRRVSQWS